GGGAGRGAGRLGLGAPRFTEGPRGCTAAVRGRPGRRPGPLAERPPCRPQRARRVKRASGLKALAGAARYDTLRPVRLALLGGAMREDAPKASVDVLREAQRRHSSDVWVNYFLARALEQVGSRAEAIRFYAAARAIRPESAHQLAHALQSSGETAEAI